MSLRRKTAHSDEPDGDSATRGRRGRGRSEGVFGGFYWSLEGCWGGEWQCRERQTEIRVLKWDINAVNVPLTDQDATADSFLHVQTIILLHFYNASLVFWGFWFSWRCWDLRKCSRVCGRRGGKLLTAQRREIFLKTLRPRPKNSRNELFRMIKVTRVLLISI